LGYFQTFFLNLLLVFGAAQARAGDWSAVAGTAGFQGMVSLGAAYNTSERHQWQLMMGEYSIGQGHGMQMNLAYFYSPFKIQRSNLAWFPLSPGLLALYALDQDDYFTESPGDYPTPNYYEQTGLRLGVAMGSTIALNDTLHFTYELVFLDMGILAVWNNRLKDASYFWSSGLKIRYLF
jgi:hypothetical protein